MSDYAAMLATARAAVTSASAVCRQVQAALEEVRSITKDDKSPVTVADFASQAIVAHVLRERLGEFTLVAEEASAFLREDEHRPHLDAALAAVREVWPDADEDAMLEAIDLGAGDAHGRGFWTLDPIDGTKGFLRNQQYAVALAYVESGVPTVGVMGCPNLPRDMSEPLDVPDPDGCLYMAIRGEGVWEASATDETEAPIHITRLDHEEGQEICVCASVEKAHTDLGAVGQVLEYLRDNHGEQVGEPVRLDSQCKYAVVARGQADAYLRLPTRPGYVERIWDHAAGSLIASQSGAAVTDIFGHDLDFTHGRGLEKNKGVICAPPRLHGLLLGAIKALGIGAS
ncbi:MAG: 3'(2'),5'-bisphosphate nucleotidase [Phycisphaeraceae bacterium]|nr:MAG: 3'(2'),5'-bisphosphate nucleotidase [Phycisphaeraceae bacterium]